VINGFSALRCQHAGQKFEQGCLAFTVFANHTDPFPRLDGDVKVLDQGFSALVGKIQITCRYGALTGKGSGSKRKIEEFDLLELFFFFHLFKRLDAGLYHICQSGLGAKAGDELLNFFAAPFIIDPGFFIYLFVLGNLVIIFGRIAGDFSQLPVVYSHGMGDHLIQKASVMGDQDQLMGPGGQKLLDPANGSDIQKIGRFI